MTPKAPIDPVAQLQGMLAQTRHLGNEIVAMDNPVTISKGAPQIASSICGKNWLAVGDAAFSVDPICGDGTGYAIREAILATTVLESICAGIPAEACLSHYTLRLQHAFSQHIKMCIQYYAEGFSASTWQKEIEQMKMALSVGLNHETKLEYKLIGFRLVPLNQKETFKTKESG